MKRFYLCVASIIAAALLFNSCDEDKDNKFILLLAAKALSEQAANQISFNTHTGHNVSPTFTEFDKDATMTSADGFILSGGSYVAVFSDGVDSFAISIPNTVTGTSLYEADDFTPGFDATYTIMIDGYPYDQQIVDGYGNPTNFT